MPEPAAAADVPVPFIWHTFDVRSILPDGWQELILDVTRAHAVDKTLTAGSSTSREATEETRVPVRTVGGLTVAAELPWLTGLYRTRFRDLAQTLTPERVATAVDSRYAVNLNVQQGTAQRYECHVDSNPIEGLLYVTTHSPGEGGELVVANAGDVRSTEAIDRDATRIYPVAGHLVFFDARHHSHYVTALARADDVRVVAAMNFYTPSAPESARPADLNRHLFGVD